jgi:hypothetical protein
MKKAKKKGVNPVVAVLLLCGSVAVAGRQFLGGGDTVFQGNGTTDDAMPPDGGEALVAEASNCGDLLGAHGSFDHGKPVRVAFNRLTEVLQVAAVPAGETKPVEFGAWTGEDPPVMQLGVVMVSEASRRAVLGGQVVGIGDQVANCEVMSIERGSVMVRWSGRVLTYDLEEQFPREFRSEMARRRAKSDSAPDTELQANQEEGK